MIDLKTYKQGTFIDAYGNLWESKNTCLLCGKPSGKPYIKPRKECYPFITDISTDIKKCTHCGLVWVTPRIVKVQAHKSINSKCVDENIDLRVNNLDLIGKLKTKGKLIDLGCGNGAFLKIAMQKGWDVLGVEPDEEKAKYAVEVNKVHVVNGYLSDGKIEKKSIDVVVMEEVLEHLTNPFELLSQVHEVLKDDGILFLTTPDISSLEARIMRERWPMVYVTGHLYFYSPSTLKILLNNTGFTQKTIYPWVKGRNNYMNLSKFLITKLGMTISSIRASFCKTTIKSND